MMPRKLCVHVDGSRPIGIQANRPPVKVIESRDDRRNTIEGEVVR